MLDPAVVGTVAAKLMDLLEAEHPDGRLVDVVIVAEVEHEDRTSYRWAASTDRRSVTTGIVAQALEGLLEGEST